jgi:hypothetical protein
MRPTDGPCNRGRASAYWLKAPGRVPWTIAMRTRSRFRRIAKWTGTSMLAAILALYMLNTGWLVESNTRQLAVFGSYGGIESTWALTNSVGHWRSPGMRLMPNWPGVAGCWRYSALPRYSTTPCFATLSIPLWLPLALVGTPTAWLWLRDRRSKPGHCQRCGYDLTGNISHVCPECGQRA